MRTLTSVFLLLVLTGCTQLQTIRVVDSQTGKPIQGVRVERLNSKVEPSAMPLVLLDSLTPAEKAVTNESGEARFKEAGNKAMLNPDGRDPTYGKAYVCVSWWGVKVRYPDEYREISVSPVNGVVEVPLPKRHLETRADRQLQTDVKELDRQGAEQLGELERQERLAGGDTDKVLR